MQDLHKNFNSKTNVKTFKISYIWHLIFNLNILYGFIISNLI